MFVSRRFWFALTGIIATGFAAALAYYYYAPERPTYYRAAEPKQHWAVHYAHRERTVDGVEYEVITSAEADPAQKKEIFYIDTTPALTTDDLIGTRIFKSIGWEAPEYDMYSVEVDLKPESASKLAALTQKAMLDKANARIATYFDGTFSESAEVGHVITGAGFTLGSRYSREEAEALAKKIAGY